MKRSRKLRKGTALLLTAGLVLTMLAPAAPVYAEALTSKIFFDTGEGPKAQFTFNDGSSEQPVVDGKIGLTGTTYSLIQKAYPHLTQFNPGTVGNRPALPGVAGAWEGYTPEVDDHGNVIWYLKDGYTKLPWLPYAFQTGDITYKMRWEGDKTKTKEFKTVDRLKLPSGEVKEYERGTAQVKAMDTVTGFAKPIPGFKVTDKENAPEKRKTYSDADQNTGAPTGEFDSNNGSFTGTMPNEDFTLTYTYEVDTLKKFNAIAKYVKEDGARIANDSVPETRAVGETFELKKADIPGYTVIGAEITGAAAPDPDNRILSLGQLNGGSDMSVPTDAPFVAKMPNQDVIVTYRYKWANSKSTVYVYFKDPDGRIIDKKPVPVTYTPAQDTGIDSALVVIPYTGENEKPLAGIQNKFNVSIDPTVSGTDIQLGENDVQYREKTGDSGELKFRAGLVGGNLTIQYLADENDNNYYSTVSYAPGAHGHFVTGSEFPRRKAKGSHTFKEQTQEEMGNTNQTWGCDLTSGVIVTADPGYRFVGWKKAGPSDEPTGDFLKGDFNLEGPVRLAAVFEEDPSMWATLTFHGINGTVKPAAKRVLANGSVEVSAAPDQMGYIFAGWFDGQDHRVSQTNPTTISVASPVDQTYTAKYSNPDTEHLSLAIPNAAGVVDSLGNGKVQVEGALPDRTYVITGSDGVIMAVRSGAQLKSHNDFGRLTPGTSYRTYETKLLATLLKVGDDLPMDSVSAPRKLTIPAVGGNVKAGEDPDHVDKARISVSPAAENTAYGLLDGSGDPVTGWITPQGSPLKVEFSGLEPGGMYTVVATAADRVQAEMPADKLAGGVQVAADGANAPARMYEVLVTGGTVAQIDGADVGSPTAQAEPGAMVKVAADGDDVKWTVLMGKKVEAPENHKSFFFKMPESNVILAAAPAAIATSSNAQVTSSVVGRGQVALNPGELEQSRANMTIEDDRDPLTGTAKNISYNVTFKKYTPVASASDAVKAETDPDNDAYQTDWAIDVSAVRKDENGVSRPVHRGSVYVIAQVDGDAMGNENYRLGEINADGMVSSHGAVDPQPGTSGNPGGLIYFQANVGSTYVLGYSKRIEVTLKDAKRAGYLSRIVHVNKGSDLNSSEEYDHWRPVDQVIADAYYDYKGLSMKANTYVPYEGDAVDKRLTLYAWYDVNPDWKEAKDKLEKLINIANPLLLSGNISRENRERLQAEITDDTEKLGQNPALGIEALGALHDGLYQLIQDITGGQPQPHNPGGDDSKGGSGGGSGGGSLAGRIYTGTPGGTAAYRDGSDGNWKLLDAANHKWAFELNSGKELSGGWYSIVATVKGVTNTGWYNFTADHIMRDGWITNMGKWYYLNQKHDGWFGRMVTGWHYDDSDHRWYYLDQTGAMVTGWQTIDGRQYYFSENSGEPTWKYNQDTGEWEYANTSARPYGSMYVGESTPDGHMTDQNGALIE